MELRDFCNSFDNPGLYIHFSKSHKKFDFIKEMAFFYYNQSHRFLSILKVAFYIQLIVGIYLHNIINCINLEETRFINQVLSNNKGEKVIWKVKVFRILLLIFASVPSFFKLNEYYLILINGAVFIPIVAVILPVKKYYY